jgi:hypothetical protein
MEEWKKIEGYEHYQISNTGRIMTTAKVKNKEMGQRLWGGYTAVKLSKEGQFKMKTIHRLLALHFIPNPNNHDYVDHINRNKLDNNLENLRWVSYSENIYNKPVGKNNALGEKYISPRGNSFHVHFGWVKLYRDFKTLDLAIAWRNEYLRENNMMGRL